MMRKVLNRALIVLLCVGLSAPAVAAREDPPGAGAKVVDVVVARPLGIAATVAGTALFILALPFSAIAGDIGPTAESLVIGPAKEAFVRCLGCDRAGRYDAPK